MTEEKKDLTIFERALQNGKWKPIRNCPGRFISIGGRSETPVERLTESKNPIVEISAETAPDKILIIEFEDGGGIISYLKNDGKFIHTLNTKEGFKRKLEQLKSGKKKIKSL